MAADPRNVRPKAWVCGLSLAGIEGSNLAEMHAYSSVVFTVCRIVSGLCDEPINRLGDSYRVCI